MFCEVYASIPLKFKEKDKDFRISADFMVEEFFQVHFNNYTAQSLKEHYILFAFIWHCMKWPF